MVSSTPEEHRGPQGLEAAVPPGLWVCLLAHWLPSFPGTREPQQNKGSVRSPAGNHPGVSLDSSPLNRPVPGARVKSPASWAWTLAGSPAPAPVVGPASPASRRPVLHPAGSHPRASSPCSSSALSSHAASAGKPSLATQTSPCAPPAALLWPWWPALSLSTRLRIVVKLVRANVCPARALPRAWHRGSALQMTAVRMSTGVLLSGRLLPRCPLPACLLTQAPVEGRAEKVCRVGIPVATGRDAPHFPSCNTWPVPHAPWPSRALAGHWAIAYSVPATWTEKCCRLMDFRRVLMAACRLCSARFRMQSASQVSAGAGGTVTRNPLGAASSPSFPSARPLPPSTFTQQLGAEVPLWRPSDRGGDGGSERYDPLKAALQIGGETGPPPRQRITSPGHSSRTGAPPCHSTRSRLPLFPG